jgi:hypothetical protein
MDMGRLCDALPVLGQHIASDACSKHGSNKRARMHAHFCMSFSTWLPDYQNASRLKTSCSASLTDHALVFKRWCTRPCPPHFERLLKQLRPLRPWRNTRTWWISSRNKLQPPVSKTCEPRLKICRAEYISCKTILRNAKLIRAARI